MLFMVIEPFQAPGRPPPYTAVSAKGEDGPPEVVYHASWVGHGFLAVASSHGGHGESKLREWAANWEDLVDFEIIPVRTVLGSRDGHRLPGF